MKPPLNHHETKGPPFLSTSFLRVTPCGQRRGVPLFVLELGLGQLTRRGTLGMWTKIGLPRWQGVGAVAEVFAGHLGGRCFFPQQPEVFWGFHRLMVESGE